MSPGKSYAIAFLILGITFLLACVIIPGCNRIAWDRVVPLKEGK